MHWKKILVSSLITIGVATPIVTMVAIGSDSRPPQSSSSYLMFFEKGSKEQQYIDGLKQQVAEVFKEYKKQNPDFKGLELEFITLSPTLTPGEINFFSELNKSLMAINPNLSFKLIQRNPVTLQQGYFQRNVDMTSFRWSPDYNGIGTWLTYMFAEYQIANLWPALASIINKHTSKNTEAEFPENEKWVFSLREYLKGFSFHGANGNVSIVNASNQAIEYNAIWAEGAKIREKDPQTKWTINVPNTTIGNAVGSWANNSLENNNAGELNNDPSAKEYGLYKSFQGGLKNGIQLSYPAQMLNYLNTFIPNIPYVQDGGNTINTTLIRKGVHMPANPNANVNYRDYYAESETFQSNLFRQRIEFDPFKDVISPFNATFTKTSTTTFNTLYTPLFSWSSIGDYYAQENSTGTGIDINYDDFKLNLTSFGTNITAEKFATEFNKLFNNQNQLKDPNDSAVELPIRPIPWINFQGKTTNDIKYLSPEDFLAGFIGYKRSVDTKFNKNNYFISLANVDIDKTINDVRNKERNTKPNEYKPFYIHFKKRELGAENIADILSMQYFNALPAFSEKVKNITDESRFQKLAVVAGNGVLDENKSKMSEFYGNGAAKDPKVWQELWFTSPYYLSDLNDTTYSFKKNNVFFQFFENEIKLMPASDKPENYNSYKSTYQIRQKEVKKIDEFKLSYGDGFKDQITYEQFKYNQLDYTKIPTALKNEVYNTSLKNDLYYSPVTKVPKSDLVPYNLQVYETESDTTPKFEGHSSNIEILPLLKSDKYGNVIFPEGYTPKQKSKITPGYTDLIVKNFYTPIDGTDENGKLLPPIERSSAIIKKAINDCINWMSINSLIAQDVTRSFQNSFFPFGVAKIGGKEGELDPRWDYWNYSAYKIGQEKTPLGKRLGGIIEWTLPEMLKSWERQMKGK